MKTIFTCLSLCLFWACAFGQTQPSQTPAASTSPIFRATVLGRTIQAVNYGHRSEPTKIDFKGTVLEPHAEGEATVQALRGSTVIDAKVKHLTAPNKFGPQFLTYVLWAITPEGRPINLGEVVLNPSDEGKVHASTALQAFGMMITAEPYYSVIHPSDVVVMVNAVREDTIGQIEPVQANADLLPRGNFTYTVPPPGQAVQQGPKLTMHEYEAQLAVYEALNAVQIAQSEGADRYAADAFRKAEQLLRMAQDYQAQKVDYKQVVTTAREATQAAEDARVITAKRMEEERQADRETAAAPPLGR